MMPGRPTIPSWTTPGACGPGWVGLVTLGDAAALAGAVAGLPVAAVPGPASLAYCDAVSVDPGPVAVLPADGDALGASAAAAVADALGAGLVPRWRARPEPSRRVARALGFREVGTRLSVRPG